MSDKTAAEALVASLRQKRKQKRDSLQTGFRDKSPEPNQSINDDGQEGEEKENEEIVGDTSQKTPQARFVDKDGDDTDVDNLPSLTDDPRKDDGDAPSPLPPTVAVSDKASVRERMRQKMLARRERPPAATTTTDAETSEREGSKSLSMTSRRLRGLREAKTLMARTRFDAAESKTEDDLEQELAARTLQMRDRWKRAISSTEDPSIIRQRGPTEEEAFDFFTGMWKADDDKQDEEEQKPAIKEKLEDGDDVIQEEKEEENGEEEVEQTEDDKKKLISDFFDDDDEPLDYVEFIEADYVRRWEREAIIAKSLYVPGGAILTAEEKIRGVVGGEDADETMVKSDVEENDEAFRLRRRQPRDWESEGFYVGAPPYVTLANRNKMESRLLTEPGGRGRKWFRADGQLDAAPLPLKTIPTRPPIFEDGVNDDFCPSIETRFVDPVVVDDSASWSSFFLGGGGEVEKGQAIPSQHQQSHLQVDLRNLSFTHHHLFSEEHVIAMRLQESYDQYVDFRKKDSIALKNLKIDTLRQSVVTIKDKLKTLNAAAASSIGDGADAGGDAGTPPEVLVMKTRLTSRLRSQRAELKQIVQLRDLEMKRGLSLTQNILAQWKTLKAERERQGVALTGGKLTIIKDEADVGKDREWWETELAAAVEMKRDDFEEEREKKIVEYSKDLEGWRRARKLVKEEEKRKKKKMKQTKATVEEEEEEQDPQPEEEDLSVAERETAAAPKPQKPAPFDEDAAISAAIDFGRAHWRKPGDPMIRFDWSANGQPVAAENVVPDQEKRRREAVGNTKISVRISYNGKEVVKTQAKSMTNEFSVSFNSSFQLRVNPSSASSADLKLEIYESTSFASSTFVAELFAPLPESSSSSVLAEDTLQFSCGRVVLPKNGVGVGSGAPMEASMSDTVIMGPQDASRQRTSPFTSGSLGVRVFWESTLQQHHDANGINFSAASSSAPYMRGTNASMTMLKRGDISGAVGLAGISDKTRLRSWITQDSNLDPNDPKNADLLDLLDDQDETTAVETNEDKAGNDGQGRETNEKRYFRLDHAHREFDFCTEEELNFDPRFRLLEMRHRKIPEFRNLKMIPAFASEIPATIFAPYESRMEEERSVDKAGEGEDEDESDVDAKRRKMIRFLQKVRKQVADRFQTVSKYKTVKDVVIEEEIPNVSTLAATLYSLQHLHRPLHPVRVPRKANVQGSNVPGAPGGIGPEVAVYVNVLRAFNLPTRESIMTSSSAPPVDRNRSGYGGANPFVVSSAAARFQRGGGAGGMGGGVGRFTPSPPPGQRHPDDDSPNDESPLMRPFVEVMFQRRTARTSTSEGSNASWNEELLLPFHPPNDDFSPTALQKIVDVIHVTLFDEVVTDISEAEEETTTTKIIRQRVVNKWLGCIKIPFTTLFFNGKIEGTFRVQMPTVLLGYRKSKEGYLNDQFRSTGNHSYLHFYLTLDPSLSPADPIRERFDSSESEQLLRKADEFVERFNSRFPDRSEVTTTVINLQGKSVFVTRFVRPLTPPMELMIGPNWQTASSAARVARFVACIPNVSDSAFFAGMCDLWSTCDQFLQMMTGDEEEHAVLLLNFFLAMGKMAWLVLGIAIPEGPTSYVLTKEGLAGDLWLWNPSSGIRYSVKDSFCPMTAIHSLINDQNIWLNAQTHAQPAQMNFDLANGRDWSAFFGGNFPNPGLSSVQPETLHYAPVDEVYVKSMSEKLERVVRENLMRWRPKQITRWNRLCSQALEKILPRLEESAGSVSGIGEESDADHAAMMEPLTPFLSSYSLTGFPLHSSFTDNSAILDAVYATGIHNNASADVEFALGVYIHAYPAHVLSVWVYVACLEKNAE